MALTPIQQAELIAVAAFGATLEGTEHKTYFENAAAEGGKYTIGDPAKQVEIHTLLGLDEPLTGAAAVAAVLDYEYLQIAANPSNAGFAANVATYLGVDTASLLADLEAGTPRYEALAKFTTELSETDDFVMPTAEQDLNEAAEKLTPVDPVDPVDPGVKGDNIYLTSGTDRGGEFNGTADNDSFIANLAQNSFAGGISNTLSSADKLHGGAGTDSLHAELVPEFFGVTGDNQMDVQPQTASIENVTFEARSFGKNTIGTNSQVDVDAKYMYDVEKIGSKFSDANLFIDNLTTLTEAGDIRHTSDMTVTMHHTGSKKGNGQQASDLTVFFDEDYLNNTITKTGSQLIVKINNVLNLAEGKNPVDNFTSIDFSVGSTQVNVNIDGAETYAQVRDMINAKLTEMGLSNVSASLGIEEEAAFSMNIGEYKTGQIAGTFNPIVITNTGSEELVKGQIGLEQGQTDGDINNTWENSTATSLTQPISINVELEKVGRDGEGGNLQIGGDNNFGGTDVDQNNGFDQFDITVKGNTDKPSNLGTITSTNNKLKTVNIKSEIRTDDSYAALTVRGEVAGSGVTTPFDGTLNSLNASGFKGDLLIGQVAAAQNINTFIATGGGDVTLNETINADDGKFSVTTGSGNDTLKINLDGNSVDTLGENFSLNSGAGNDLVKITMVETNAPHNVSYQTMAKLASLDNNYLKVDADAGNDTVYINGYGSFKIDAGPGNDFVVINAENTLRKVDALSNVEYEGEWTFGQASGAQDFVSRVLYEAKLKLEFAGFESLVKIPTDASGDYIATQATINAAIKEAIAKSPELQKLLVTVDGTGTQEMSVRSLVNGENHLKVSINQPEVVATSTPTLTANQVKLPVSGLSQLKAGIIATTTITSDGLLDETTMLGSLAGSSFNGAIFNGNIGDKGAVSVPVYSGFHAGGSSDSALATDLNFSEVRLAHAQDRDLVVLDSNDNSINTLKVDAAFGHVSVVNFHNVAPSQVASAADVGRHALDFTKFLNNERDPSATTNTDSKQPVTVTLNITQPVPGFGSIPGNSTALANSVNMLRFQEDLGNTAAINWAGLNAANLVAALNGTGTPAVLGNGGIAAATLNAGNFNPATGTLIGHTQKHIVMVENIDNPGEYKVFSLTSTVDTDGITVTNNLFDTNTAQLLGTMDFGASINFNLVGSPEFELLYEDLLRKADSEDPTEPTEPTYPEAPVDAIVVDSNKTAVDGVAELFLYNIDSSNGTAVSLAGGDWTIDGFNAAEDSIVFNDVDNGTLTTRTFGYTTPTISESGIGKLTDFIFADDAEGNAYKLTLAGVVDQDLQEIIFFVA